MQLDCTCETISIEQWNKLMKGAKPCSYKRLISRIKANLPNLYEELCLDLYNPWHNSCRVTKTHYILVWSAIEFFISK